MKDIRNYEDKNFQDNMLRINYNLFYRFCQYRYVQVFI